MSRQSHLPDPLRVELAHALGFVEYPTTTSPDPEPYLNYIVNRCVGRSTLEEYLKLVIHVIEQFKVDGSDQSRPPQTIQSLIEDLTNGHNGCFCDTQAGSLARRDVVEDTVMYVLGIWTLLVSSFVHLPIAGGARKITLAFKLRVQGTGSTSNSRCYDESLSGLLAGSGLLPSAAQWNLPLDGRDSAVVSKPASDPLSRLRRSQDSGKSSLVSPEGSMPSLHTLDPIRRADTPTPLYLLDDLDSLESLHVAATRMNAYTLSVFGAVDIAWTHNISRHMLLCKRSGRHVLEVFSLPCALSATTLTSSGVGVSLDYVNEIAESYSILFNAWPNIPLHAKLGKLFGVRRFCWCWSCSARRHRDQLVSEYRKLCDRRSPSAKRSRAAYASEFDPLLIELMDNEASDWTPEIFPSLWPRIMALEEHLQSAKPWNIWVLFRDRRDTLQFWTFCFATIVLMLTIVQVILGVAQVVGSFS